MLEITGKLGKFFIWFGMSGLGRGEGRGGVDRKNGLGVILAVAAAFGESNL
jgi:hypothetical protein